MPDVNANPIINYTGTIPGAIQGLIADRPAVGYVPGMWYLATDSQILYGWTGTVWVILLSNGGAGGTPTLQQVTDNGNTTTNFLITNFPDAATPTTRGLIESVAGGSTISVTDQANGKTLSMVMSIGSQPLLIYSANGHTYRVIIPTLTGNFTATWPNKSGTVAMTSDIPAAVDLQAVLTVGNTSTLDIFLNTAAVLKFTRTNVGSLTSAALSAARTWTLPNQSGTVAMTSDIPATPNLQAVTAIGNQTTNDIILTGAANVYKITRTNIGSLTSQTLGSNRTWTLPNTDGVVAMQNYTANNQSGTTYQLVLADQFAYITCSNAGTITLTIPANATVALPLMTPIPIEQGGAGKITIVGAGGVTTNSKGSLLSTNGQYVVISIIQKSTDVWTIFGDLTT